MRLLAVALAIAICTPALAGAPAVVARSGAGVLVWDGARTQREHPCHFNTPVQLFLSEPRPYAGLMIERVEVWHEWRCRRQEHRLAMLSFYTKGGRYVRSERGADDWRTVRAGSELAGILEAVCSGEKPTEARALLVQSLAAVEAARVSPLD